LPAAELEVLADHYRENATAMPEWMLLARHHGDGVVEEWLVERAHRLLRRGIATDTFALVVMLASFACAGWFLFKGRKSAPFPRLDTLERSWSGWRFAQEFLTAELLGLYGGMLLSRPLYAAGSPGLAMFLGSLVQGAVTLTWLFSTLTPGFRFGLAHFLPESRARKNGPGGVANFGRSFLLGMTALAALIGVGVLYSVSGIGLGSHGDVLREESLDWVPLIASNLIVAVVIAPVGEEIVFRGFLHGALRARLGPVLAAVPGSLLFAALHGYSIPGLIGVFFFGLVFTWIYERSGSLLPGMIAHSLFNLVLVTSGVAWYSLH
jgi:membrane protease YdiL (CAAX protease family)